MAASRTTPAPVEPPPTTRTSVSSVGTATGRSIAAAQGLSPGRGLSLKPVALRVTFFRDSSLRGVLAKAGPGTVPGTGTAPRTGGAPHDVFRDSPLRGQSLAKAGPVTVPERGLSL